MSGVGAGHPTHNGNGALRKAAGTQKYGGSTPDEVQLRIDYGTHQIRLTSQAPSSPHLMAISVVKVLRPGVKSLPVQPGGKRNEDVDKFIFHGIFDKTHARDIFNFLGVWLIQNPGPENSDG